MRQCIYQFSGLCTGAPDVDADPGQISVNFGIFSAIISLSFSSFAFRNWTPADICSYLCFSGFRSS